MSDELMELPEGWEWIKLGDICEVRHGYAFKSENFGESGPIVLTPGNFTETGELDFQNKRVVRLQGTFDRQWILRNGDLLIVMTDLSQKKLILGVACVLDSQETVLHNQRIGLVIPLSEDVSRCYLRYAILNQKFKKYIDSTSTGTLITHTSPTKLLIGYMPLPSLNEQRRIVAKIEELRERSQKARSALSAIPNLCDKFRQSVLAAAFRGDLTADWREQNPDVEPASVLLERVGKELGQNLADVQTEIDRTDDEIPSTWAWAKLKLMIKKIQPGNNFLCPEVPVTETTVGLVKISAVTWGTFNPKETKTVADPSKVDPNLFIQPGDLLVTRANTLELVGASVVVDEIHYKIMLSDKVWRVDILEVDKKYINFYLRSKDGRKEIESRATGNQLSMRNISQNAFRDVVIAIPPIEEQKEIVRQIESCFKNIDQIKQTYQETKDYLNQLDRSILAKAFRGELVEQDPKTNLPPSS